MKGYKLKLSALIGSPSFPEASREELRVLLALVGMGGAADTAALAEAAGVSAPRVRSALVLWEESGIIELCTDAPTVTEEFEERVELGKLSEIDAAECARDIRNNDLVGLIEECAALMGKPALSTAEAKKISTLYTQLSLSEDYILTLAAYLVEKNGRLSMQRLEAEAERLVKRGVGTTEELELYLSDKENQSGAIMEIRRVLDLCDKPLSETEQEYIRKWCFDLGYSAPIVKVAYDVMRMGTGSGFSLPYMDTVLTNWHNAGCKTAEECRAMSEKTRAERAAEEKKTPPRLPRTPKEKPRYGDFDPEEAFKLALARSYREDDDGTDDDDDDTEDRK